MALFNKNKNSGFMDQIRCDETEYLIWKWHPIGSEQGNNTRENAIRWGSSLRVKEGSVAVFVYKQKDGTMQDYIMGPFDETIKTTNFPVLSSIVGLAFNGGTPFQAEIYFINLAGIIQIQFGIPFFDVFDPRFLDFGVPTAVRGTLSFKITDYKEFIKLHRLDSFSLHDFKMQIRDAIVRYIKNVVTNAPEQYNIPVLQIERKINQITELVEVDLKNRLATDFGVTVSGLDIGAIEIDKESEGYLQLKRITQDVTSATIQAQTDINVKNLHDMQRINAENTGETLRIQREESQYAQRKQTQTANFAAYQIEQQAAVGIAGANALGQMGAGGGDKISSRGISPAAIMAGMAMSGAIGRNMAGMMNGMMDGVNNPQQPQQTQPTQMPPPPPTAITYHIAVNGQTTGPFDLNILMQMVASGKFTKNSLVWTQGMTNWAPAETVPELQSLFGAVPPPPPIV